MIKALSGLVYELLESLWPRFLLVGLVFGVLSYFVVRHRKRKILISVCLTIFLFLPAMIGVIVFSEVNQVRLANLWIRKTVETQYQPEVYASKSDHWNFGFGRRQILPNDESTQPLYIAGYNNGLEITDVHDYCEARAVWMDTGEKGILLIGIDCIALDSSTVQSIRDALSDLSDCAAINVYATHTHAGIDTLGMWGPVGVNGKNDAYMKNLVRAAKEAGREAAAGRAEGSLYFGQVKTENMYRDSRDPYVCDENLYQLRFEANDTKEGVRLLFYGAHAESLRGDNTLLSRDFPGMLCDKVTEATGDHTMFLPGAIGGLIMTKEFINTNINAVANMNITADQLIAYALSITQESEQKLSPELVFSRTKFVVPMDNTAFFLYKFLGILNQKAVLADSATGYGVETELAVLILDDLAVTLIPGEIFPELVLGGAYGDASPQNENPEPLSQIASAYGIGKMLIVGLANDEIGYIVPPSDFLLNETMPYLEKTMDYKGENHYEETNSIGFQCADRIAEAFEKVVEKAVVGEY